MTHNDRSSTKSTLLFTLLTALVIVVGLQAWYMAGMKQQLDDLRNQTPEKPETTRTAKKPIETAKPVIQPPQQPVHPPATQQPGLQRPSPFDDNWFNQPFDAQSWDPYQEIERMQHEMDQMFNEAFGRFDRSPDFRHLYKDRSVAPDIDLKDEGDKYIAMVNLPGSQESDLSVNLENQVLTISGRLNYEEKNTDSYGNTVFRERRSGNFNRSIALPEPVRENGMQTELVDGVLKITIPKAG
jgi:HSP20 family protein